MCNGVNDSESRKAGQRDEKKSFSLLACVSGNNSFEIRLKFGHFVHTETHIAASTREKAYASERKAFPNCNSTMSEWSERVAQWWTNYFCFGGGCAEMPVNIWKLFRHWTFLLGLGGWVPTTCIRSGGAWQLIRCEVSRLWGQKQSFLWPLTL